MRKRKGSVLVQVLMTAVIVSIVAAGMMNLILLRAAAIKHAQGNAAGTARTNTGLDAVLQAWSAHQGVNCSAVPAGYNTLSAGSAGGCNCSYQSTDGTITVTAALVGGNCSLTVTGTTPP